MSEDVLSESQLEETFILIQTIRKDFKSWLFSSASHDLANEEEFELLEDDIRDKIDSLEQLILDNENFNFFIINQVYINRKFRKVLIVIENNKNQSNREEDLISRLYEVYYALDDVEVFIDSHIKSFELDTLFGKALNNEHAIRQRLESSDTLVNYLRQAQSHKIYVGEAEKFKRIAFKYELSFYCLLVVMFFYFSGLTMYIPDIQILGVKFGFPEKNLSNGNVSFYIQKISVLVLTSTLAAFLLKRSFMNRDLFQEAYRVAQELNALPPYIQSFSQEVQDKIRLDLAYKYFGREHNSDKGAENFMAENIKANTEFLKVVKDLSSGKADKALLEKTEQDKV